jgi:uncharacterized membrane protein YbhN (UPF0104 family)
LLGGVTVALVLHAPFVGEFWKTAGVLPLPALVIALSLVLVQLGCQTLRLWALIPRPNPVSVARVAYAFTLGGWVNIFAPLHAGDAFRAVLLTRAEGEQPLALTQAAGAILADRVVDIGSLIVLCAAGGLLGLASARMWTGAAARAPSLVVGVGATVLVTLLILRMTHPRWLARVTQVGRELLKGASALRDPVMGSAAAALSVGAWVAELLAIQVLCGALGFSLPLPRVLLALVLLNVGISVPISVANVGPYEAALAFGLRQVGVPLSSAVVLATVHHALELLAIGLVSAGLLTRAHAAPREEPSHSSGS